MSDNDFKKGKIDRLFQILAQNKSIIHLDLSKNKFGRVPLENMNSLAFLIEVNKTIRFLSINGNNFGQGKKKNMKLLISAFQKNQILSNIDLAENFNPNTDKENITQNY